MSAFLAQWVDLAQKVSADDTVASIAKAERERIAKLMAIAIAAESIPRRLGGGASSEELMLDKKRCKRIAHVASQLLGAWEGKPNIGVGEISKEAAIVDWKRWWEEHHVWLLNRQRYIATWCHKTGADEKWCKSAIVKLTNELRWLEYALRD
jgi:hypothetical protein